MKSLTLEDIANLPRETITPAEAASITGGDPHLYRIKAKTGKWDYPYGFEVHGRNTRIYKREFLKALGYEDDIS